jgi:hypothetical protein
VLWEVELGGHYRGHCRRHPYDSVHKETCNRQIPFCRCHKLHYQTPYRYSIGALIFGVCHFTHKFAV